MSARVGVFYASHFDGNYLRVYLGVGKPPRALLGVLS